MYNIEQCTLNIIYKNVYTYTKYTFFHTYYINGLEMETNIMIWVLEISPIISPQSTQIDIYTGADTGS